jgi:phenylacetate-CoA ligase
MQLSSASFDGRRAIEADQLVRIQRLLAHILPSNAFYTRKLAGTGITAQISSLTEFCSRVPFTSKPELVEDQLQHPPFGSNLTYPLERYTRFCQTSGTTARPLRWLDTAESWDWMVRNWLRVFESAEVTAEDRVFFAFSFGPFLGFWLGFDAAAHLGCLCIPGGGLRSAARLHAMIDSGATVLCCTPTYAIRLAEVAAEEKIDLGAAKIRRIIAAGEPGASVTATRTHIAKLWNGARIIDHHGMTEIGPVSYACPAQREVLHIIESSYFAEVLDPATHEVTPPGEVGELVLTNFGRTGSPLLRYRTGDLVRLPGSPRCECGSTDMALLGGILGRVDDMVTIRGVNVFPAAIEDAVRGAGGVAEYRVEIRNHRSLLDIGIQIEPEPGQANDSTLAHRIQSALLTALTLRVPVTTVPPGTLPRFEMKAQRWVRV